MNSKTTLSMIFKAVDRVTAPLKKINGAVSTFSNNNMLNQRFSNLSASLNNFKTSTIGVISETKKLGIRFGVIGGLAGFMLKRSFIDTSATFEKFQNVLEITEGTAQKAKSSLDWVSSFATKTPYEFDQVMDSFVKLRTYGLQPMNGLLRTLGDTSSAMGKPLIQAVEAMADAVTGENERLKEFGIKARIEGKKVLYEYSSNGKTLVKEADISNRQMIQSTLEAIFNEKYSGAMEKQSKSWVGMLSNISDMWTRFKLMIMDAGVFDFLKSKLSSVLETVNNMSENGSLKKYAEIISSELIIGLKNLWDVMMIGLKLFKNFLLIVNLVANSIGGYANLVKVLVVLLSAKLIISIAKLGKSFFLLSKDIYFAISSLIKWIVTQNGLTFSSVISGIRTLALSFGTTLWAGIVTATTAVKAFTIALLSNPITWIIAGIVGLIAVIYLLVKHWDKVKAVTISFWNWMISAFGKYFSILKDYFMKFTPAGWILSGIIGIKNVLRSVNFFEAGKNIISSIVNGIKSVALSPVSTVKGIVQKVRNLLPFSPAKDGPLKDIHKIRLIETIESGINPIPLYSTMKNIVGNVRDLMIGTPSLNIPYPVVSGSVNGSLTQRSQSVKSELKERGSKTVTLHYAPEITIEGDASESTIEKFKDLLKTHKNEIIKLLKDIDNDKTRKAY